MLEKTLESPLDCKEIKPVNPQENQSWIFIGRTDAETETPKLWPPDVKNWLLGKDPDAGEDWRWEEKRTTEDEMVGWHHRLNGHEFEQALRDDQGQGSLVCGTPWGHKESDTTVWLNWSNSRLSVRQCGSNCILIGLIEKSMIWKKVHDWTKFKEFIPFGVAVKIMIFWRDSRQRFSKFNHKGKKMTGVCQRMAKICLQKWSLQTEILEKFYYIRSSLYFVALSLLPLLKGFLSWFSQTEHFLSSSTWTTN